MTMFWGFLFLCKQRQFAKCERSEFSMKLFLTSAKSAVIKIGKQVCENGSDGEHENAMQRKNRNLTLARNDKAKKIAENKTHFTEQDSFYTGTEEPTLFHLLSDRRHRSCFGTKMQQSFRLQYPYTRYISPAFSINRVIQVDKFLYELISFQ